MSGAVAQQRTELGGELGALGRYWFHQTSVHETTASGALYTAPGGVRYTLSTYPRKPKDSLFSGTLSFILQCCGSLPHTSPTFCLSPKSRPLQLPLSCFNTDAFSAFPSSSICPVRSKQSSCHALQSGSGLLLKLWAAALPLLHCSSQQPAPQTSGLTPFYLQSLISRSTSITSLNIVFT